MDDAVFVVPPVAAGDETALDEAVPVMLPDVDDAVSVVLLTAKLPEVELPDDVLLPDEIDDVVLRDDETDDVLLPEADVDVLLVPDEDVLPVPDVDTVDADTELVALPDVDGIRELKSEARSLLIFLIRAWAYGHVVTPPVMVIVFVTVTAVTPSILVIVTVVTIGSIDLVIVWPG